MTAPWLRHRTWLQCEVEERSADAKEVITNPDQ
jgi:hypothetical protein